MKNIELLSVGAWAPFDHIFKMSKYPSEGETIQMDMELTQAQTVHFGDCSANIAFIAAGLGVSSALASVFGSDFDSSGYRAHLEKAGVNLEGVTVLQNQLCGHNYIFFDHSGDGFCISHRGAAQHQNEHRVPKHIAESCKNIVISEQFSPYTLSAAKDAKNAGARVFLNGMVDTADELIDDFLTQADVLFINNSEFERMCEKIGGERRLFDGYKLELVFVTRGRLGSRILSSDMCMEVPASRESCRVEDVTGAGDSFAAGAICAMIRGFSPVVAARVGATVASFVIEEWGCQTGAPGWQDMERRMELTNWENDERNEHI